MGVVEAGLRTGAGAAGGARDSDADTPEVRRSGRRVVAAIGLALLVGYLVSFGSTLWMEYK